MLTDSDIEIRPLYDPADFAGLLTPQAKAIVDRIPSRTVLSSARAAGPWRAGPMPGSRPRAASHVRQRGVPIAPVNRLPPTMTGRPQ
jgi:hypothetical protein